MGSNSCSTMMGKPSTASGYWEMKPLPMLAASSSPFDNAGWRFEVKWDGIRAVASIESGSVRLWGRDGVDYTGRYPELDVLRQLPGGTMLDGELVMVRDG